MLAFERPTRVIQKASLARFFVNLFLSFLLLGLLPQEGALWLLLLSFLCKVFKEQFS